MGTLIVGDSHLKVGILDESRKYIHQLLAIVESRRPEKIVLLGDQFDTFAVVRSEILSIWAEFFREASKTSHVIALVGNHDLAGADGGTNPMEAFRCYPNVTIVDRPMRVDGRYYFPYFRDTKSFESECRTVPVGSELFCHQSFDGATFENGFFDPHGASIESVAHLGLVVSGHIHRAQRIGNVWYPGAPFQHSFADAGERKYIYFLDDSGVPEPISVVMPEYVVIAADTLPSLVQTLSGLISSVDPDRLSRTHLKLVAPGTPSEITEFWRSEEVLTAKTRLKRVVDGLTAIKPSTAFSTVKGETIQERFHDFVTSRSWRTDSEQLADRAARLLWS